MKIMGPLIVLTAALACAAPAMALSITQTLNFSFPIGQDFGRYGGGIGYQPLFFNQFDDCGGTLVLRNVMIDFFAVAEGGNFACENDSFVPGEIKLVTSVDLVAEAVPMNGGFLGTGLSLYQEYGPWSVDATDGLPVGGPDFHYLGMAGSAGWAIQTSAEGLPENLSTFVGTETFLVQMFCTASVYTSGVSEGSVWIGSPYYTYGDVTITYEYGYEYIPEPGTLALIAPALLGLAGIALRRMRRG